MKSPPSFSVAEVRTTERSAKSFSRSSPETDSGATRSDAPKRSWRSYQTTSHSEPFGDPLGDAVDVLHGGEGLLADGVLVLDGLVAGVAERGDHLRGRRRAAPISA